MTDKKSKIVWTQIIITTMLMLFVSLVGGIILYHYTSKSPDLVYENFEVARFAGEQEQIGIYSAYLENIGDLEAEDVQITLDLPYKFHSIEDIEIKPSMKSISYEKAKTKDWTGYIVTIPRLNPNESCYFAIYLKLGTLEVEPFLETQVRAKGITGHIKEKDGKFLSWEFILIITLSALLVLVTIFLGQHRIDAARMGLLISEQYELLNKEQIKKVSKEVYEKLNN
ncbi:MAG: hypothetical protein WC476_12455 [Phycisphaerae bacterium]